MESKEKTFLGRLVSNFGGLFLRGFDESKNFSHLQLSPFRRVHIVLDKKLVAFFIFGIILFFFAETFSRHMLFFYASGLTLGLLMSWMFVLILILKLIPYKKSFFFAFAAGGTSLGLYLTQTLLMNLQFYAQYHAYWLLCYTGIVSLLTFAVLYYKGPPKNTRTLNLIKWSLQILGLMCIFNSTWALEVAVTSVVLTITLYFTAQHVDISNLSKTKLRRLLHRLMGRRIYPQKRKLLTEDEYREQAERETKKALQELRGYCSSPDCNSWKVVSRLKDPKKFASFVQSGEIFQQDELDEYDKFDADEDDSWLSTDDESGQQQQPESTVNKSSILGQSFQLSDDGSIDLDFI
eukprot:gene3475-3973_t